MDSVAKGKTVGSVHTIGADALEAGAVAMLESGAGASAGTAPAGVLRGSGAGVIGAGVGAGTQSGDPLARLRAAVRTRLRSRRRAVSRPLRGARPPFAAWVYVLAFVLVAAACVSMLQWSVMVARGHVTPWEFFVRMFPGASGTGKTGQLQFLLNLLIIGAIYAVLVMAINRFWLASGVMLVVVGVIAVLERMKVLVRSQTIMLTDITLMASGGAGGMGDTVTNMPAGSGEAIAQMSVTVAALVALVALAAWFDGRGWLIVTPRRFIGRIRRAIAAALCMAMVITFGADLGTSGSWAQGFAAAFGDKAKLWDSIEDAQANGVAVGFLRLARPKVMDQPAGYDQATMRDIANRYASRAHALNASRTTDMRDQTVVMILSESFSDPTRVPGVKLNEDPMPYIRSVKASTTSGLMLSSGYGGGTANLEFQALTGLSMVNFDPSLSSPYQQLVPQMTWTPSFNQIWAKGSGGSQSDSADAADSAESAGTATAGSEAVHPYNPALYSRSVNYRKFGFSHFYSQSDPLIADHARRIDRSHYISDETSYDAVLRLIENAADDGNGGDGGDGGDGAAQSGKAATQFIQLVTMQNHMGYENWYDDNQFKATSTNATPLDDAERTHIDTYAKGMNYTDQATKAFLGRLDAMSRPITVIFYGDHLPSIYKHAAADDANSIALHETDYFIWSNKAARLHDGGKATGARSENAYTSPNYLMAQTAEHMNARVSPYLAFLTDLHRAVPAMEPPVVNVTQGWDRIPEGSPLYLDASGRRLNPAELPQSTQRMLRDYRLIQYDITAGKSYLRDLGFMDVPQR